MGNKSVPQLDAVSTLDDANLFHVVVDNVDKKITKANLKTSILGTDSFTTIYTTTVTLTSAQILSSYTTPIELISSAGTGKAIVPLRAIMKIDYGTTAYATNTNPAIYLASSNKNIFLAAGSLAATLSKIFVMGLDTAYGATDEQIIEDKAVYFKTLTGNPTAGDSLITLYIQYIIIDL